ncbi:amidohydrolase family protein [Sphingomonas sp. BN140010]|uniref:Amidohydrolase family protein n=1 Tax=Sphingomonas arvum TaxID=2992113 RepID=A0ABT3JH15_9SPHN|nr:amidohydrolase family protein [Sphingomonas sp. BN140010]MCW3798383.1 amidohydrolase family protein [Sphingomonas sp. BN140010]
MRFPILLTAAALTAVPAHADTLVRNVRGVQVDARGQVERFTGLLFDDTGKVRRVLHGEQLKLPGSTRVVDGGGRAMLPGLIDAHGHVMELGLSLSQLDLTGTRSVAELQQRLRAYAAANPDLPWIIGRGWNQELWPDKRFPTAADLDAVVNDRPVWLGRVDGHANVGNSAALRAAGVTAATKAPSGGRIEQDAAGRPTGLFVDAATGFVERSVPAPTAAMRRTALLKAQADLLSKGLTAVADMGTSLDDWAAMQQAYGDRSLQVRIMSYAAGPDALAAIARTGAKDWLFADRLKLLGVKLYADGALGSRGAWLKRPYADAPTRGLALLTPAQLKQQAGVAAAGGYQIAVHAIGDAANDMVLTTYEQLGSANGDRRWRAEHAQIVDTADLDRFARGRIIASMQPVHQTSDRLMAEARLGQQRSAGAYAWQTLEKSGARLAFGSDFPVEDPNPFHGLAAGISRQGMDDQPPGGWRPWERLTFAQALKGFTRDAAWAGFAEQKFGSLEPGKWADFILVDRDISAASPHDLARTQVLETWVAGQRVWARDAAPVR